MKVLDQLTEIQEEREDVYCDRTDEWRGSEKGERYEDLTNSLEETIEQLDYILHDLNDLSE